uniref:Enoyl-CoA hydratase/isomerase n=1 Tax=Caulobacter sp. (strain K31) TaxID=366602 RepID=B0T6G2_CAUSK
MTEGQAHADDVSIERRGPVAIVTVSRPPNNHFTAASLGALADALETLDADRGVYASVLASTGPHFCAGADLSSDREDPRQAYRQAARLFALRKPIIAAVQGGAIGGGLGLALVADFRVVSPSSRLAANFVKIGIHPGFALTLTLPALIGAQRAATLLLTGRRLTGEEATAWGLADRIAPEESLQQHAVAFAEEIAANAPLAVQATRATLRAGLVERIKAQLEHEAGEQLRLRDTADFREGVSAVRERRPGLWRGC